jgi:hypothetical protein
MDLYKSNEVVRNFDDSPSNLDKRNLIRKRYQVISADYGSVGSEPYLELFLGPGEARFTMVFYSKKANGFLNALGLEPISHFPQSSKEYLQLKDRSFEVILRRPFVSETRLESEGILLESTSSKKES